VSELRVTGLAFLTNFLYKKPLAVENQQRGLLQISVKLEIAGRIVSDLSLFTVGSGQPLLSASSWQKSHLRKLPPCTAYREEHCKRCSSKQVPTAPW
jgi:hypothetical protein